MVHVRTEHFADGTGIGIVPVTGHLSRTFIYNGETAAEELLGSSHVARHVEHRIDQVTFLINRAVQVTPLAFES